eukprot:s5747_g3.t1
MPRSLASSSEGYSAESYATTPSVESADALERAAKLRRQQEEREARKRAERQALQDSFALAALFEVCMYYLEAHIRLNNPDRRSSSAKLAAQRRQLRATDPRQVHAIICPQLEDAQVRDLDRAYTFVGGLFQRGVLPNDLDWLEQTGSADGLEDAQVRDLDRAYTFVGGLFQRGVLPNDLDWLEQTGSADGPPRHVCVQHLGRIARRHLRQHLEPGLADHLVMHLVGQTNGLLHFASLHALLPLLDDEGTWVEAFARCGGDAAGADAADSGANVTVADFASAFIDF